jgi:hypothetical protein
MIRKCSVLGAPKGRVEDSRTSIGLLTKFEAVLDFSFTFKEKITFIIAHDFGSDFVRSIIPQGEDLRYSIYVNDMVLGTRGEARRSCRSQ